ncbi:MAG: extracellular solute-binding protein [Eubacteriales bacterium]
MKRLLQGFLIGILLTTLVGTSFADTVLEKIEVAKNKVNIELNGNKIASANNNYTLSNGEEVPYSMIYNGTTYLPIRKVAEIVGKYAGWDGDTNTVILDDNPIQDKEDEMDEGSKKELRGTIDFWHFYEEEAIEMADAFMEEYPNTEINVSIYNNDDFKYESKVLTASKNRTLPDIITAERSFVRDFVEINGLYEDLSQFKDFDEVADNIVPYTIEVGTDKNGAVKALSYQALIGAVGYKRDIAKKYLGTDDPAVITEMLKPENMLDTAKELKEKSAGRAKLWASLEALYKIYLGSRENSWVENGKFTFDSKMDEFLDLAKELRDEEQDGELPQWEGAWLESIQDDIHMCYAIPNWGINWIIDFNESDEYRIMNNGGTGKGGRWGLATPMPYFEGGTWYGIGEGSENKELAWEFIKFITNNDDFSRELAEHDLVSNVSVFEEKKADNNFVNPVVDQNIYEVYGDIVNDINGELITSYDTDFRYGFLDNMNLYLDGEITKEECIKNFIEEMKLELGDEIDFDS